MLPMIGYGEDGLTLWVLSRHLPQLLEKLGDDSHPAECLRFYRPSFGRKGGQYGAEFGEFDAILATRRAIYPFDSKGVRSATRSGLVTVKHRQVLRHQIFEWLRERWQPAVKWQDFVTQHEDAFQGAFKLKPLAPPSSALADNTEYILNRLAAYQGTVQHVVLVFYRNEREKPKGVSATSVPFRLVTSPFQSLNPGGLFEL